jgi:hypothetical protein
MGSEKSAIQVGNGNAWGVDDKNVGGGVGVYAWLGITEGDKVNVSTVSLTGNEVERLSPIPQARITMIAIAKKNKDFIDFIFPNSGNFVQQRERHLLL